MSKSPLSKIQLDFKIADNNTFKVIIDSKHKTIGEFTVTNDRLILTDLPFHPLTDLKITLLSSENIKSVTLSCEGYGSSHTFTNSVLNSLKDHVRVALLNP